MHTNSYLLINISILLLLVGGCERKMTVSLILEQQLMCIWFFSIEGHTLCGINRDFYFNYLKHDCAWLKFNLY